MHSSGDAAAAAGTASAGPAQDGGRGGAAPRGRALPGTWRARGRTWEGEPAQSCGPTIARKLLRLPGLVLAEATFLLPAGWAHPPPATILA